MKWKASSHWGQGFLLALLVYVASSGGLYAQTEVYALLEDSQNNAKLQKRGVLQLDEVKKELEALAKKLSEEKKKKHQSELNGRIKTLQEKALRYQAFPKNRRFRRDGRILGLRGQIAQEAKRYIEVLLKLQSAHTSIAQSREGLRAVLLSYLQVRKKLKKFLAKKFPEGEKDKLKKLIGKLKKRLGSYSKQRKKSVEQLRLLNKKLRSNQTLLLKARQKMLREPQADKKAAKPKEPAKGKKGKQGKKKGKKKPKLRPRPRRRRFRPRRPRKPRRLTPAERRRLEQKQERERVIERLVDNIRRARFYRIREYSQYLRLQKREEKLLKRTTESNIHLLNYTLWLMQELYFGYTVKARLRLLFHDPLGFDQELVDQTATIFGKLPEKLLAATQQIGAVVLKKGAHFLKEFGLVLLICYLLFPFLLFVLAVWLRVWLSRKLVKVEERSRVEGAAQAFWQMVQVSGDLLRVAIPYAAVFGVLLLGAEAFEWPEAWGAFVLTFGLVVLGLRLVPTLAGHLFAEAPERRLLPAFGDGLSRRLRRVLGGLSWLALVALCVLLLLQALGSSPVFDAVYIFVMGVVLWGFACVFVPLRRKTPRQEAAEAPEAAPTPSRWSRALDAYFYPMLLFFGAVILLTYLAGYRNLAAYLLLASVVSVGVSGLSYAAYYASNSAAAWALGAGSGASELPKRTQLTLRYIQLFLAGALSVFALSVVVGIWRIPGGYWFAYEAINYPLLKVQKTRLSALSILSFMAVFGSSIWLSRWVRGRLEETLYPMFQVETGDRHALNVIVGYSIVLMGGLGGLQVMGMSLGVLTVFAGVVGIGVGFGLKDLASNFIAGMILTFNRPFAVGDAIIVNGAKGMVTKIGARHTTINHLAGFDILIPNSQLVNSRVDNLSAGTPLIWAGINVELEYGCDVDFVLATLGELGKQDPRVTEIFPVLSGFSSEGVECALWVGYKNLRDEWPITGDLKIAIYNKFNELGLEFSGPRQEVHFQPEFHETLSQIAQGISPSKGPKGPTPPRT